MMRIFLVDDHPLYRKGVSSLIRESTTHQIYEFDDISSSLISLSLKKPDVIFLDIELADSNGIASIEDFLKYSKACRVAILTSHDLSLYVERAEQQGASAYILKNDDPQSILDFLERAPDNQFYLSPKLKKRKALEDMSNNPQQLKLNDLTEREQDVMRLLAQDMTSKEIAEKLNLSFRTVQNHRANIKSKLGLLRNSQLLKLATKISKLPV